MEYKSNEITPFIQSFLPSFVCLYTKRWEWWSCVSFRQTAISERIKQRIKLQIPKLIALCSYRSDLWTRIHLFLHTGIFFCLFFPLLPFQGGRSRQVCSPSLQLLGSTKENRFSYSMYPSFMYPMNYKFRIPLLKNSENVKKNLSEK